MADQLPQPTQFTKHLLRVMSNEELSQQMQMIQDSITRKYRDKVHVEVTPQ